MDALCKCIFSIIETTASVEYEVEVYDVDMFQRS